MRAPTVTRRAGLFAVLPVALVLAAGYGWYRWSDTGKGWRYEDKLATYCDGLIPYAESAVFTDLNTEVGLSHEVKGGVGDDRLTTCDVADMRVTVGLTANDAVNSKSSFTVLDMLHTETSDTLPMALGGGWEGYTDLRNTAAVLSCGNKPASLVVSIASDESHENPGEAHSMAELATATARKAAPRWSCETKFGGRIPKVAEPDGKSSPESVTGTCKGVPLPGSDEAEQIDWLQESRPSSTSPLESCELGGTNSWNSALYQLDAAFGPYAQRLRTGSVTAVDSYGLNADAGLKQRGAWATAACPGAARAVFAIYATESAEAKKALLLSALSAFAQRAAERHGCTDLKLPT